MIASIIHTPLVDGDARLDPKSTPDVPGSTCLFSVHPDVREKNLYSNATPRDHHRALALTAFTRRLATYHHTTIPHRHIQHINQYKGLSLYLFDVIEIMQVAGCGRYGVIRCFTKSPSLAPRPSTWRLTVRGSKACTRSSSPSGRSSAFRPATTMTSLSVHCVSTSCSKVT